MFAACAEVEDENRREETKSDAIFGRMEVFGGNGVTHCGASFDLKSCNAGLLL